MNNVISLTYRRALRDVHESRARLDALYSEKEWGDESIVAENAVYKAAMERLRSSGEGMAC